MHETYFPEFFVCFLPFPSPSAVSYAYGSNSRSNILSDRKSLTTVVKQELSTL